MDGRFPTTRWSVVLAARSGLTAESRGALAQLCEAYWYPLYAYLRRTGSAAEDAEDLIQSYFAHLMERDVLQGVAPENGRLRSFLLATLRNFRSHERDRERALKRGGGCPPIRLDAAAGERRYRDELVDPLDAERLFERRWALTVLERSVAELRAESARAGQLERFDRLYPHLTGGDLGVPYREIAAELGTTEGAIKVAIHRLRRRLGDLLRREIAHTVADRSELDGEVRHLLVVLAESRAPAS